MFSVKMQAIYKRLLILALLSMCLFVFGYTDEVENVQAATLLCAQDCDRYFEMCNDSCQGQCGEGSTDTDCNSCLTSCSQQWNSCSSRATYCTSGGTVSYNPQCAVQSGRHCIDIGGSPQCATSDGGHDNYFETCNRIGYENGCIVCPTGEICQNDTTGGLPQCLDN